MSVSKLNISEKLEESYMKEPHLLKMQAVMKLAIQLCQNAELKNDIIFESQPLRLNKNTTSNIKWDALIEKRSTDLCNKLSIPPALKEVLIAHIRAAALQLFSWNRQQTMFNLCPPFADSLLTSSDWAVDMRLDEKKIAERLVQDERISVFHRYKMACWYCLELFIPSLWKQISSKSRDFLCRDECLLVRLWSLHVAGKAEECHPPLEIHFKIQQLSERLEQLITRKDIFWCTLVVCGLNEGSRSTVFYCWDKMHMNLRQEALVDFAIEAMKMLCFLYVRIHITEEFLMNFDRFSSPLPFTDILYFFLMQMSKEQRIESFQTIFQNTSINVLFFFLQWPYLGLLVPLIKDLWNILPEKHYDDIFFTLENYYTNGNDYLDSEYGCLMVELLEEAPDHFKRHLFSDTYLAEKNPIKIGRLLCTVISKKPLKIQNIRLFQQIWQHVRFEEKQSFLSSIYAVTFCCHLALEENLEVLNSILWECLAKDDIIEYKKKILMSQSGKKVCFLMLARVNEDSLISWLNWGFPSEQEIVQFILEIFLEDKKFDFKKVSNRKWIIETDCLDNVINRYIPPEDTRRFKSRFVEIYSMHICFNFVIHTKWQEIDRFLVWGFPQEDARKQFKTLFIKEYAMQACEYNLARLNLKETDQFLTWCFPTKYVIEQFKQEFFFSSGLKLPWVLISCNLQDLDCLIKWFGLSPEAVKKFKRQVLFCPNTLSTIFDQFPSLERDLMQRKEFVDEILQKYENFLRWGLTDEDAVIDFKDRSDKYIMNLSFTNTKVPQLVQQTWNKLINGVLLNLPIEQKKQNKGLITLIVVSIVLGSIFVATQRLR